ncbi:LacI family DNA-binding transcriptional regulator, partial [Cellulomonas septica]
VDAWVEVGDFSAESGARATERLLERHPDLDGVIAGSDNMAAGALRTLRAHGRSVPDDVAVVGFDDLPVARQTEPPLTTVRQPIRRFGAELAASLVQVIEGRAVEPVLLPTTLVVRESAPLP